MQRRAVRYAEERVLTSAHRATPSRLAHLAKRSFATEKLAAKPAGKPGAAPAAGKAAAAAPQNEDDNIPPRPPPLPKNPPADPNNPLHPKHAGIPLTPHGTIPEHVQNIAEAIQRLNMFEAMQLNILLQEKLGITEEQIKGWFGSMGGGVVYAAPPPGAAGAPAAAGAAAAPKEEKKEKATWNLKLVKFEESSKVKILKEFRVLRPGMNLAEVLLALLLCSHLYVLLLLSSLLLP